MKSVVFGDGLLCVAFAGPGKIQHGTVDRLPLLLQTEAVVSCATTFPTVLPIRRPRQSNVDLRAARTRVTTPAETEARPRPDAKLPQPQESLVEDGEHWKLQSADPTDHP